MRGFSSHYKLLWASPNDGVVNSVVFLVGPTSKRCEWEDLCLQDRVGFDTNSLLEFQQLEVLLPQQRL